nr:immunoglobulin heavy chain junction region [Macaca mulatta]MOX93906.1 immunoglobulin heavy chain junction region [Macaca mulatta]MOX95261.1 immunoglobulin heavy chain junction region [Macaca mulatta]MOX96515.1 immunoglobulin heavy chain junction region [Macaca mulatta]MOX97113.1 immunoglobulin heavy chain junction region [Macaca mulatta]
CAREYYSGSYYALSDYNSLDVW